MPKSRRKTSGKAYGTSIADETNTPQQAEELTTDLDDLSESERDNRREALKSMLSNNVARQQAARSHRRPSMAIGERVSIVGGELHARHAKVLDADFITSRALLQVDDVVRPLWVTFNHVGPALD